MAISLSFCFGGARMIRRMAAASPWHCGNVADAAMVLRAEHIFEAAIHSGRGDRTMLFAAVHESGSGTFLPCQHAPSNVGFRRQTGKHLLTSRLTGFDPSLPFDKQARL
jgi:hypothetical protein